MVAGLRVLVVGMVVGELDIVTSQLAEKCWCNRRRGRLQSGRLLSRARLAQRLDRRGVISAFAMPAVFRSMHGPVQGWAFKLVIGILKIGLPGKDQAHHLRVPTPRGPVARGN